MFTFSKYNLKLPSIKKSDKDSIFSDYFFNSEVNNS
jgi:hypothetical protein